MYYNIILSLYYSEIIFWYCLLLEIIGLQNGRFVQYTGLDSLETQIDTTRLPHPYPFCGRNWLVMITPYQKAFCDTTLSYLV